jgi:hypothetical protein
LKRSFYICSSDWPEERVIFALLHEDELSFKWNQKNIFASPLLLLGQQTHNSPSFSIKHTPVTMPRMKRANFGMDSATMMGGSGAGAAERLSSLRSVRD